MFFVKEVTALQISIPQAPALAIEILEKAGYEAYLVGGCVRDACRGALPHDWDIATSAMPEETMAAFEGYRVIETGLRHGTVTVLLEGEPLEITTFRTEGSYADHRHPETVSFVRDLSGDLQRRDFTVNAMAYSPRTGLVDLHGGAEDLKNGILRAVGDPDRRFEEDALRILRGLRFAARLGYAIEAETRAAMSRKAGLLSCISHERVREELKGLIIGRHAREVLLTCTDVLAVVLPEILPAVGFAQHSRYHAHDVWTHTAHAVSAASAEPAVRWALLLHDLGKPAAFSRDEHGEGHFYGHAGVSARLAETILDRLRFDNAARAEILWLVEYHDLPVPLEDKPMRRLLSRHGAERVCRLLQVQMADHAAQAAAYGTRIEEDVAKLALAESILAEAPCLTLRELAVDGRDLMALGHRGKAVGQGLQQLLDAVIDGKCPNEREALLRFLQNIRL